MSAPSISRYHATPLPSQINISPCDRKFHCTNLKFTETGSKHSLAAPILACAHGGGNYNNVGEGKNKSTQAIELQRILDDVPYVAYSKNPNSLPRPLSNSVCDGSRLRVAYQGVHGAYSESAAEKAYPKCEAVPCEQFDTAFEVNQ